MSAESKRWQCWICTAPQESIDRPKIEVCDDCVRPVAAHLCREGLGVPLTAPGVDERFWMVRAAAVTLPMLRRFKVPAAGTDTALSGDALVEVAAAAIAARNGSYLRPGCIYHDEARCALAAIGLLPDPNGAQP